MLFCRGLECTAQNFAQYDGQGNEAALQTGPWKNDNLDIISDSHQKPLNASCSDAILCKEVLGQDSGAFAVFNELLRSLKKGGTLLTAAPFAFLSNFAPYLFFGYKRNCREYHFSRLGFDNELRQHDVL